MNASSKQIDYIKSLLSNRQTEEVRRQVNELTEAAERAVGHAASERIAATKYAASLEVQALFAKVVIPEGMSQARASRWIELLKDNNLSILDKMIADPRIAAGLGVEVSEELFSRYAKGK